MRLDKYLKVSRLVKRRTLAKEISEQGRVTVNGNVAKAGTDIKENDELIIRCLLYTSPSPRDRG